MPTSVLMGANSYRVVLPLGTDPVDFYNKLIGFTTNNASVSSYYRSGCNFKYLYSYATASEVNLLIAIDNTSGTGIAWVNLFASNPIFSKQSGKDERILSTLELYCAGTLAPTIPKDAPAVMSSARIWLRMGHGETYLDTGSTKIRNYGLNGVAGYLLCGGAAVGTANCRQIDYGTNRGFRSNVVYGAATNPVVRIPLADIATGSDFTVAVLYSNRHQTEANAWATLMQLGPNAFGECVVPCRNFSTTSFSSQIGNTTYADETLCNMGKGSIIFASGSGVLNVYKDERELTATTKTAQTPSADHCFGGGYTGSVYFSSQAGIFEIIVWNTKLSPAEVATVQKYFELQSTYELDIFDGQSNNNGQGLTSEIPENYVLNNKSRQYDFFRNQKWQSLSSGPTGFGPWLNYQYLTSRDCVIGGRNGTSIAGWLPENDNTLSENIYDSFAKGIWGNKSGTAKFENCFFHQGETDAESGGAAALYSSRLTKYARYRRELMQNPTAKIVTTTLPTDSSLSDLPAVNLAKSSVASGDANMYLIEVPEGMLNVDNIHLNASGQLLIGAEEAALA